MARPSTALCALAAALALSACGGDSEDAADRSAAAPPAAEFPSAEGRSLSEVLAEGEPGELVVSPAGRVLRKGTNRFGFGVFTTAREQVADAEIAIYAAPRNLDGPAVGPFPARIYDLTTQPAFRAKTTVDDPDAATVVYVADLKLPSEGAWAFGALVRDGEGYTSTPIPTPSRVGQLDPPQEGERAPRVSTPTADDVPDISQIDTRIPPGTMHDEDLAEVLAEKPVVLLFATPALCQSRVCGPVVDIAEQVKRDTGDGVAFIHQEIFKDNDPSAGTRPQVQAYDLPTEPWLFVIDRDGVIDTAIEGAFGIEELTEAVEDVSGGR